MKRHLSIIVLCLISGSIWAQFQGAGTSTDPFLINDTTALAELARQVNNGISYEGSHFLLTENLDLSDWDNGDNCGWKPIGSYEPERPFKGKFDGNNKVISGLTINRPNENNIGLWGCTKEAEIKNFGLINVYLTGDRNVGGLVGSLGKYDIIDNCYSTGWVSGARNVGGLVGWSSGDISKSYAMCKVYGIECVGGLAGWALGWFSPYDHTHFSSINYSFATGSVNGESHVGGLTGWLQHSNITNSYATSQVNGTKYVGGLAGMVTNSAIIDKCYAYGEVIGTEAVGGLIGSGGVVVQNSIAANPGVRGTSHANRLIGDIYEGGTYTNNYALSTMALNTDILKEDTENGISKSLTELQSFDFYTNSNYWKEGEIWDLQASHTGTNNWNLWQGHSFPYFQWQAAPPVYTGNPGNVNGFYRTDDNQTTDSLTFYLNGVYHSGISSPSDGKWAFNGNISEKDVLTVIIHEAGQAMSSVDITGVNSVSNQLITLNKVWAANKQVFMQMESDTHVQIYNISGVLVNTQSIAAGETRSIPLSSGIYIVKAGNQSHKVIVN